MGLCIKKNKQNKTMERAAKIANQVLPSEQQIQTQLNPNNCASAKSDNDGIYGMCILMVVFVMAMDILFFG